MPQSLSRVLVHLIFSTKNREPLLLQPVRIDLHAYLAGILRSIDCPVVQVGGVEDHVHLLFALPRTLTMASIVEEVKTGSSKWLKTKSAALAQFHWQSGYGVFGVSESNAGAVDAYIRDQERHHAKMTFQEEFRRFLLKHRIVFDERYVWD